MGVQSSYAGLASLLVLLASPATAAAQLEITGAPSGTPTPAEDPCLADYTYSNCCGNLRRETERERCDDGDRQDGDGCSSSCQIEAGWQCSLGAYGGCVPICVGDCDHDRAVTVAELMLSVRIALGLEARTSCNWATPLTPMRIGVLIGAVRNLLEGCPPLPPTRSPTPSLTPKAVATPTPVDLETAAEVCVKCGEEYVDESTTARLVSAAGDAMKTGVQVDVREYIAA